MYYALIGFAGGVLGGMGMGGGTLLIPMLILFMGVSQHGAQGANLLAFIPMSIIALLIHLKNKLVEKRVVLPIALSAAVTAALGSFLSLKLDAHLLRLIFGIFLTVSGCVYMISWVISRKSKLKVES
ncbi:MAG: sulfite exporter TauE/SafE family protein [Clostridiales bacterium]|nr:sulfite exporter TauE/SafE family protein [Clostridiales bacterium]